MPLPSVQNHGAQQCHARAKSTGQQCLNPSAFNSPVCRMHGARKPASIKRGRDHPNYRHGWDTQAATKQRQQAMKRLKQLEGVCKQQGLLK